MNTSRKFATQNQVLYANSISRTLNLDKIFTTDCSFYQVSKFIRDNEKAYKEYGDDTKIATQAHSFRCGLVAQQYKLFNKLNYIFNFTMEIFTYAI